MSDSPSEPTASTPDDGLLVVSGEVDLATVPELRRRLGGVRTRAPELTVDLSAVTFIDCAGLRPLLEARKRQRADGGRLVLMSPSWAVVRLLQFTGLLAAFTVVDALSRAPGPLPTRRRGETAVGRLSTRPGEPTASRGEVERLRAELLALRETMRTRPAIDQAKGMLMAVHRCDAEQAWSSLARASQTHNVKVRDLAEAMIRAAETVDAGSPRPTLETVGDLRPELTAALRDVLSPPGDEPRRAE